MERLIGKTQKDPEGRLAERLDPLFCASLDDMSHDDILCVSHGRVNEMIMASLRIAPFVSGVVAVVLTGGGTAQSSAPLTIVRATIVDVVAGGTIPDSVVTIEDGVIVSVRQGGQAGGGGEVYDAEGRFLMPGLWDMHAHLQMSGEFSLATYLANGVTGVRDMGSDADVILPMRESTASGRVLGPRIVAAGPILDDAPEGWPNRVRVRSAEDGRAAVRLLKAKASTSSRSTIGRLATRTLQSRTKHIVRGCRWPDTCHAASATRKPSMPDRLASNISPVCACSDRAQVGWSIAPRPVGRSSRRSRGVVSGRRRPFSRGAS